MTAATLTPSLARGIQPVVRTPDFVFDDSLPDDWFAGDPALTSFWNAFGVLASIGESQFIDTGRWLLSQMSDPVVIDETTRFIQQEAQHGAVHARMNRVLAARGYPVEATRVYVTGILDEIRRRFDDGALTAWGLAGEQAIGEIGHAVMANPDSLGDAAELPRALLLWHFYEEVEHQAALYDGFMHVYPDPAVSRRYRRLGAVLLLLTVVAVLPAVTWVFCRHGFRGQHNRRATWRPLWRQLLGEQGLLRGGAANLRAFLGEHFHPFDQHDPAPTLAARKNLVKPEWTQPVRQIKPAENAARPLMRLSPVRTTMNVIGFAAFITRTTWRYLRETRPPDVRIAG